MRVEPSLLRGLDRSAADLVEAWRGTGCDNCRGTGYRGRTGVYEMLEMTRPVVQAANGGDMTAFMQAFPEKHFDRVICSRTVHELADPTTVILEALRVGRALTVERFPRGTGEKGFMQKNAPEHFSDDLIRRHEVAKEGGGTTIYPVVDDAGAIFPERQVGSDGLEATFRWVYDEVSALSGGSSRPSASDRLAESRVEAV